MLWQDSIKNTEKKIITNRILGVYKSKKAAKVAADRAYRNYRTEISVLEFKVKGEPK